MLTTEQVKNIAEYIWASVPNEVCEAHSHVIVETKLGTFDFDPAGDDSDSMMVFKALVDECKKRDFLISIEDGKLFVEKIGDNDWVFVEDFNNESICLAYLAVMESK